jgi:hypothetical protein
MPKFIDVGHGIWVSADEIVGISEGVPTPEGKLALAHHGAEPVLAVVLLRGGQLVPAYRDARAILGELGADTGTPVGRQGQTQPEPQAPQPDAQPQASQPREGRDEGRGDERTAPAKQEGAQPRRRINPIQLQKYLKGINYPTRRGTLVETAQRQGAPDDVIDMLGHLPDQGYNAPKDVSKAVGQLE